MMGQTVTRLLVNLRMPNRDLVKVTLGLQVLESQLTYLAIVILKLTINYAEVELCLRVKL